MRFAKKMFLVAGFLSVAALAAFSQSPSLSTVIDNLRSTDSEVRLSAARSLPWLSQNAVDPRTLVRQLTPLLASSDAHVRLSILTAFQMMVLLHPEEAATIAESKSALIKATDDPLEDVRQYATAVLGLVQPATDEDLKRVVIRGLADPSHKVRKAALGTVSFKKLNNPEIVTAALAVASSRPEELARTVEALGDAAPTDPRAVELFVSALGSKSEEAKRQSLTALSKAGRAATAALPMLRQLAVDPNESELVKKSAKDAIRKVEP